MTSRERVIKALKGDKVDQVPVFIMSGRIVFDTGGHLLEPALRIRVGKSMLRLNIFVEKVTNMTGEWT